VNRRSLSVVLVLLFGLVVASGIGAQAGYFWDDPQYLVRQGARYPVAVDNGKMAAAFWQERRATDGWPQAFLSVTVRHEGDAGWTTRRNVLGPFTQVGASLGGEVQFYSVVLTPSGVFWVSILGDDGQLVLYRSDDGASTFQEDTRIRGVGNFLAPKLFLGVGDEPLLTVTVADGVTFRIATSRRTGGRWSDLKVVTTLDTQRQSFQPSILRIGDKLVMVYQSQVTGRRITYQIYRQDSADGGLTWGAAERLSRFADELSDDPDSINNQRPVAYSYQGRLFVAWERQTNTTQPVIEMVSYGSDGKKLDNTALTSVGYSARNPLFYTFRDQLYLAWFDNRNDTYDLYQSTWDQTLGWENPTRLSQDTGNSVFGQPARLGSDLYFFWQNNFEDNPGIVMLQPDRRVDPPTLRPVNFKVGVKTNKPDFTVEVVYPRDVSGIRAFNALLTQDPEAEPDHDRRITSKDHQYGVTVPQEGLWYLAVTVLDLAGNWSTASRIPLNLKTTPPGPVLFDLPATDPRGFLTSNTFQLSWKPTSDDVVAYSWRVSRVGDAPITQGLLVGMKAPEPSRLPLGTDTFVAGENFEDGLWTLAVATFDEAGNRGPTTTQFFRLNKFRPSTLIQFVDTSQDPFGRIEIVIHGRGFTAGGALDHVFIDRDGKAPWDYDLGPQQFHLASDRLVDGIKVEGLAEGVYRIGVSHPDRGIVFTGPVLKVEPTGTVKIGDFRNLDQTVWEFVQGITVFFSVHAAYFWATMVLLTLVGLGSFRLLVQTWAERRRIDRQVTVLFADNPDKWARRARSSAMKTRGLSLTVKFAASILGLTATVITMLSVTMAFFITENSQQTLGTALQQRTQVLLDSLATGARTYVPSGNVAELGFLPPQISAMEGEALYATITGPSLSAEGESPQPGNSYVYASNDPDLAKKIDTASLRAGISVLKDPIESQWTDLRTELNQKATAAVGELVRQIEALETEVTPLAIKLNRTAAETEKLRQNQDQSSALRRQVITKLIEVAGKARSVPEFDPKGLLASHEKRYVFYQPYFYLTIGDPTYVRGLIRIEVSSEKIEKQITTSRDQLIQVTLLIAAFALAFGLIGAFLLSAITINPIRQLSAGVAKIRDTDDKTHLDGHSIDVRTRDELEDLASIVNEMTHSLVKGAKQSKEMAGAKGLQKNFFITLDKDATGNKLTTFSRELEGLEVFAYYEGAKTVSGDLYEFRQLDTREGKNPQSPWYGLMKGDISGKGVEALLAMTIAAAFVTNFFRRWTEAKDGRNTKIDEMLYAVNDNLEPILAETGQQKFAALNVGILNAKTGELQFSQAGDNLLHLWRAATAQEPAHFELKQLAKTAPAGLESSRYHMVRYANQKLQLQTGDTLLYFTDGIEESQCTYRNKNWEPVAYFDPADPSTLTVPGARRSVPVFEGGPLREVQAKDVEDFGPERMEAIIEAYQHGATYQLIKQNWEHPEIEYHFDFRGCDGSARGLVLALISIDRIFRLVPDPKSGEFDYIDLDLVENEFLKKHFVEFDQFFKDGFLTYRQAIPGKENRDKDGFFLAGAVPIPVWQRGNPSQGDLVDAEGFKLVDGERVQDWVKAGKKDKGARDAEGYLLVDGKRVRQFVKGDLSKGDSISPEGYKLSGGEREHSNPGYIRYKHLQEDHQFDDLTLLAIRKK